MFKLPVIYLLIQPGHLLARNLNSGQSLRRDSAALAHPRTLMGDFQTMEQLFREVLKQLSSQHMLAVAPKVLVHLLPNAPGGYTDVEERAFMEAARGAGARVSKVITTGAQLSDEQVLQALR